MSTRPLAVLLALLPLLALAAPTASAGDDAQAVKLHIEVLVHESQALKAQGRHDAAEVLMKRALELKARLAERGRQEGEGVPLTMEQAEKALHGLEMGVEALKVLRREPELKALAQVADGVRKRMQQARAAQGAAQAGEQREIEEARRRLELYRTAFHGLREGEKREAMERMEHAIHALELRVAGRRDDEAQEIRRTAPKIGEQIELLQLAAKLWDGFGHETKARALRELAEQMAQQAGQQAGRRKRAEPTREAGRAGASSERLEKLHQQLREIRTMVERFERELRALEARGDGK